MQAPAATPHLVLQDQLDRLRQEFSAKAQQVSATQLPDDEHNATIQGLQKDFDKQYKSISDLASQFEQTQKLADAGLIPADKAEEAMYKMILPKETIDVMFPTGGQTNNRAMSTGELTGKPMQSVLSGYANAAPKTEKAGFNPMWLLGGVPGAMAGLGRGQRKTIRSQKDLVKQYQGWREMVGYDTKNAAVKTQLDTIWDDKMAADKSNTWDVNHPDIQSLRAKGALTAAYGSKNRNAPITGNSKTSPFISHVQEQVVDSAPAMVKITKPDGSIVKVPKGEWESQKSEATKLGYKEI
jgi:hypothetical protein